MKAGISNVVIDMNFGVSVTDFSYSHGFTIAGIDIPTVVVRIAILTLALSRHQSTQMARKTDYPP